jgi:O-antigen ligase
MTTGMPRQAAKPIPRKLEFVWIPAPWVEYTFYVLSSYSIVARALGIEIPLLAAGSTVVLGGLCLRKMGSRRKEICAPIVLLLACQFSFILIQAVVHGASVIDDDTIRTFILWMFATIIVQSLCLRRGFLQRCTMIIFMMGVSVLPFMGFSDQGVDRAGITVPVAGNLTNANGLASWFGFCAVFFSIACLETRRSIVMRIIYALGAVGSLLIVGLTVSRGGMFGCALALTVGFRRFLKRAFLPVLLLVILGALASLSGLFDQILFNYEERGMEETGRIILWPLVIERFLESPTVGVGLSTIGTWLPDMSYPIPPHNSFLYFALSSGIVPLVFYVAFWVRASWRSFSHIEQSEYAPLRIPFLLYLFVSSMLGDISTAPWVLLTFSVVAGPGISHRRERLRIITSSRIRRVVALSGSTRNHPRIIADGR